MTEMNIVITDWWCLWGASYEKSGAQLGCILEEEKIMKFNLQDLYMHLVIKLPSFLLATLQSLILNITWIANAVHHWTVSLFIVQESISVTYISLKLNDEMITFH